MPSESVQRWLSWVPARAEARVDVLDAPGEEDEDGQEGGGRARPVPGPAPVGGPPEPRSSVTQQTLLILTAKTLAFAFTFFLPLLLVRYLSQTEFGLYRQVFLLVATAVNVLPLGFYMSAYYFLPREQDAERRNQVVLNILVFHTVVAAAAAAALVVRPELLVTIFNSAEMVPYASLIAATMSTWMVASSLEPVVLANQEIRLATILIMAADLTKSLFILVAALAFTSVRALIVAAILQGALQTAILLRYLWTRFPGFWRSYEWSGMRTQLAYALPFGVAAVLFRAQLDLPNYFVAHLFGPAAFAVYAIGCFQLPLIGILYDSVGSVMVPRVSYLQSVGRSHEIVELIARMMRYLAVVSFPIFGLLLVTGLEFLTVLFTDQYRASLPIFAVNLTMIPLRIITSAYDPVMRAYPDHRYFLIRVRIALLVVLVLGLWVGTARLGMLGAIMMAVGVSLVERVIIGFKVARILGVTRRDYGMFAGIGKIAAATAAAAVATAFLRSMIADERPALVLVICAGVFAIVYLACVLLLGVVTPAERRALELNRSRFREFLSEKLSTSPRQP